MKDLAFVLSLAFADPKGKAPQHPDAGEAEAIVEALREERQNRKRSYIRQRGGGSYEVRMVPRRYTDEERRAIESRLKREGRL